MGVPAHHALHVCFCLGKGRAALEQVHGCGLSAFSLPAPNAMDAEQHQRLGHIHCRAPALSHSAPQVRKERGSCTAARLLPRPPLSLPLAASLLPGGAFPSSSTMAMTLRRMNMIYMRVSYDPLVWLSSQVALAWMVQRENSNALPPFWQPLRQGACPRSAPCCSHGLRWHSSHLALDCNAPHPCFGLTCVGLPSSCGARIALPSGCVAFPL